MKAPAMNIYGRVIATFVISTSFVKNADIASPPNDTKNNITDTAVHCNHIAAFGIPSSTSDILPGHNSFGVPSISCFSGAYVSVKYAPISANTIDAPTYLAIQLPIETDTASVAPNACPN